ncbi:MAG: PhzF family phenazine biosynthesis protein [Paracoccus sp. (in: a-proteobacteria)]
MRMYQVDAFSGQLFAGNPAAVLPLDDWLPEPLMQAIVQESNLAETAFLHPNGNGWDLRWFTPVMEVDFCGHATLASAHVLTAHLGARAPLVFQTRIGELRVEKLAEGYRLDLPCLPPRPLDILPADALSSFTAPPERIFRNFENICRSWPCRSGAKLCARAGRADPARPVGAGGDRAGRGG